ncbi:pyridoxamine kinase [Clostridium sp. MB05]|jgi:pyridoxine kinase
MKGIKKVATINDLSGIGRCSLTAAMPILSALGVQCCPFPTAILSSQTEFDNFTFLDITSEMKSYKKAWNLLNLNFDCIYSGFLGSEEQINIVLDFAREHKESLIVIDPVMGDNGIIYDTYTENMCNKMKELISIADIATPNLTEACILTGNQYNKYNMSDESILNIAKDISKLGPSKVIITGIIKENSIYNFAYNKSNNEFFIVKSEFNNESYSGTGDIFTSVVIGLLLNNHDFKFSIEKATEFIYNAIQYTTKFKTNPKEGVIFELFLKELILINENKY